MYSFSSTPCFNNAIKTQGAELAWTPTDARTVLQWLSVQQEIVLGGDILHRDRSYTYANWYYNPDPSLSVAENSQKSCSTAMDYLEKYAQKCGNDYLVIIVVKDTHSIFENDQGRLCD